MIIQLYIKYDYVYKDILEKMDDFDKSYILFTRKPLMLSYYLAAIVMKLTIGAHILIVYLCGESR